MKIKLQSCLFFKRRDEPKSVAVVDADVVVTFPAVLPPGAPGISSYATSPLSRRRWYWECHSHCEETEAYLDLWL